MDLVYLEFETRYYWDALKTNYSDLLVDVKFDKISSVNLDENLQVCTSETIRGKNKTFNAYLKPKIITISASFSDRQTTNIHISGTKTTTGLVPRTIKLLWWDWETYVFETTTENISRINKLTGQDKSKRLEELFNSMVEDSKLVNIKTFYGDYENYVLTGFNLTYSSASVIEVDLTFQEILLREASTIIENLYKVTEEVSEEEYLKTQYLIAVIKDNYIGNSTSWYKYIKRENIDEYIDTYSQGGHYGQ